MKIKSLLSVKLIVDINYYFFDYKKSKCFWMLNGAPEGIRTPDRSVRSRVLYPAELRMRVSS